MACCAKRSLLHAYRDHDLVFLGSCRSTLNHRGFHSVSILTSHHNSERDRGNHHIMTLGGLALAVGILVDDATVEIET